MLHFLIFSVSVQQTLFTDSSSGLYAKQTVKLVTTQRIFYALFYNLAYPQETIWTARWICQTVLVSPESTFLENVII